MFFSKLAIQSTLKQNSLLRTLKTTRHLERYNSTNINITASADNSRNKDKSNGTESSWSGKNAWKLGLMSLSCMAASGFALAISYLGPPQIDMEGNEIRDKYSEMNPYVGYLFRASSNIWQFKDTIKDPVSDKLLPDPVKPPYFQPEYTVVIELTDVLVHPDWTFRTGWRFKKRPALEMFFQQLCPFYEVVCFTQDTIMTMAPVLEQLDAKGEFIHYRLFRESTRYRDGVHIKDLSCLNRDLSKVILVDCSKDAAKLQPDNALILKPWSGNDNDRDLIDLAAFLRMIAMSGVEDVRLALGDYIQNGDPLGLFRQRHHQLMEMEAEKRREKETQATKKTFNMPKFNFNPTFKSK